MQSKGLLPVSDFVMGWFSMNAALSYNGRRRSVGQCYLIFTVKAYELCTYTVVLSLNIFPINS